METKLSDYPASGVGPLKDQKRSFGLSLPADIAYSPYNRLN